MNSVTYKSMIIHKPIFLDKASFDSYIVHKETERRVSMDTGNWITFNRLCDNLKKWLNTLKQFVSFCWRFVWVCLTILWGWHLKD